MKLGSINETPPRKSVGRLVASILTIWLSTVGPSFAEWGVNVPISHPRFCEMQEIRVSRIADYLFAQILKRNMDTSTSGYIHPNQVWEWKKIILSNAGKIEEMRYKRDAECGEFADQIINVFERVWSEVQTYGR